MAEKEKKIRVHNRGKRVYTIPSASGKGKTREIQPGRAVDLEESTALKYLKNYPKDLIRYDSLVSDEDAQEKAALQKENEALKKKLAAIEAKGLSTEEADGGDSQANEENADVEEDAGKKKSGLASLLRGKKE